MISSMTGECRYDFNVIYLSLEDNINYFYFIRNNTGYATDFVRFLKEILSNLKWYEESLKELYLGCHNFDFNNVEGNGFRSFILIFERCFSECYSSSKKLCSARSRLFFRHQYYKKETQSILSILEGLKPCLKNLFKMMRDHHNFGLLMPAEVLTAEELIRECAVISQLGFYGRFGGFYYSTSIRRILQGVCIIMATFSDFYHITEPMARAFSMIFSGVKYTLNPELRAQKIVYVAENAPVEFLKEFWSLGENPFMKLLPRLVCPKMRIRENIAIPYQTITMKDIHLKDVVIPVPSCKKPYTPIRCLLLSTFQVSDKGYRCGNKSSKPTHLSSKLLLHCHGGGFVSQNPESHEIYLRHWANDLNMPIVSIDYTLSPEAQFPRALEEALLTYAWIMKNPKKLGWTGEKICFAGDSAGGTIMMGLALKLVSLNIQPPDATLCVYTPLVLELIPSPSRLFCWIDPFLPLGFIVRCLDAYAGHLKADPNEYYDESLQVYSSHNLRRVSSYNEAFDSSLNIQDLYKQSEFKANEPYKYAENFHISNFNCLNNNNIDDFSKSMAHHTDLDENTDKNLTEEHEIFSIPSDIFFDIKLKWEGVVESSFARIFQAFVSSSLFQTVVSVIWPESVLSHPKKESLLMSESSLLQKIKNLQILSKDPFMSPLYASDDMLKKISPVHLVTSNFDPCIDESISLAKRLQSLNRHVTLDIVDSLPHGFLNFLPFSQAAHDGSNICVHRLKEAISL